MSVEIPDNSMKILVCYHKPYTLPPNDRIYLPVHAGAALSNQELNIQRDDELNGQTCDNISEKNENYCELTAMYWAWKNLKTLYPDVKYVGLFHYRRFLDFDEHELINALDAGKIILSPQVIHRVPNGVQYCIDHISDDYRTLCEVMKNKFPDCYDDFMAVMENDNRAAFFNMFIMRYDEFTKYCEWLFPILSEVEALIPYKNYDSYQRRVFGFMAERLLNVYVYHNRLKAEYHEVYDYPGELPKKGMLRRIYTFINHLRVNLAFKLMYPKFHSLRKFIRRFTIKSPKS